MLIYFKKLNTNFRLTHSLSNLDNTTKLLRNTFTLWFTLLGPFNIPLFQIYWYIFALYSYVRSTETALMYFDINTADHELHIVLYLELSCDFQPNCKHSKTSSAMWRSRNQIAGCFVKKHLN